MISRVVSLEAPGPFMRMIIHRGCGTSHRHHAIIVLLRWVIVATRASTLRLVAVELILLVMCEVCIDVYANIYIARRVMHGLLLVWHVIIVHAIPSVGRGLRHETLVLLLIFRVATAKTLFHTNYRLILLFDVLVGHLATLTAAIVL
jgi:hypothetical protein